jgi:glycerophosphoryl diester phosphodiesterase
MGAFKYCVEELNTDCLELDVHLTKDRILVVCHDRNLKRLTGVDIDVSQVNYHDMPTIKNKLEVASQPKGTFWQAETSNKDNLDHTDNNKMNNNIRNGLHKRSALATVDLNIPKLEDVFLSFPNTLINLDVKSSSHEMIDMVSDLVIKYNRENNIVWGSDELPENCDYLYKKNPNICICFNYLDVLRALFLFWTGLMPFFTFRPTHLQVPFVTTYCFRETHTCDQASWYQWIRYKVLHFIFMQKAYFQHLEARGIPAWVWIINCEQHFEEALNYGIKGIFTDYPTKLKRYLEKRNN